MSVKPRAWPIVNYCQRPGAFLTAAHVRHGGGREFYPEPGSQRVRTKYALETIRNGWLIAKDLGLFGDDPQTWACPPKPAAQHTNTNPHFESPAHGSKPAFKSAEEKTTMVDAREFFGTTFITLKDLTEGPVQAVIDRVEEGKFGKLVLSFADNTAISLNATNSRALVKAFGSETDDWPGHAVELSPGEIEYQGKPQPAILVTNIEPPPGSAEKTGAKPKPSPRGDGRDMDDGIPF